MKWIGALACTSLVAHGGVSVAEPSYAIANAPSKVHVGQVFSVDLVLDLDGNASTGHEVSVEFTPGVLVAEAAIESGAPPYRLELSPGVRGIDNAAGVVEQFEAAAITAIAPDAPFRVGRITFRAGQVGRAAITGFFAPGAGLLDADGEPIEVVEFKAASIQVVPAPKRKPE